MKFKFGKLIENFAILPSISINWMTTNWVKSGEYKTIYDIQFSWFKWYISTGNINKYLKSKGY